MSSLLFTTTTTPPNSLTSPSLPLRPKPPISLPFLPKPLTFPPLKTLSTRTFSSPSEWNSVDRPTNDDEESEPKPTPTVPDEWGERSDPDTEPPTRFSAPDPPKDEDEWGNGSSPVTGGGDGSGDEKSEKLDGLKRGLVDTCYGTDFGFRAPAEIRAEVLELVVELEGCNPTPNPTEAAELLDGNWILLYTASSELLPLLAVGTTPLLKVEKISQEINTSSLTIVNTITFSSPFATFSSSASAIFEVRGPSRIQVEFKEGIVQPPDIKSSISLPEEVDIFGQKINLSPLQQSLNPLQEAVAGIARTISGQSPLKIPIPGERTKSWLLITYLDKDLRISRGDGGLFILAKEGSLLLNQ